VYNSRDIRRSQTAEMKFIRYIGYILLEHRSNENILEEFKVHPVGKILSQYKQNG
jgi:hypothetical protein